MKQPSRDGVWYTDVLPDIKMHNKAVYDALTSSIAPRMEDGKLYLITDKEGKDLLLEDKGTIRTIIKKHLNGIDIKLKVFPEQVITILKEFKGNIVKTIKY